MRLLNDTLKINKREVIVAIQGNLSTLAVMIIKSPDDPDILYKDIQVTALDAKARRITLPQVLPRQDYYIQFNRGRSATALGHYKLTPLHSISSIQVRWNGSGGTFPVVTE